MNKLFLTLLLSAFALSAFALPARASIECGGESYSGYVVRVLISTSGARAEVEKGKVTIKANKDGSERSYDLKREEISQFFEWTDNKESMVGMIAYQGKNNPVTIKYIGKNYEGDLEKILKDQRRTKIPAVEMRVWKGPGFEPTAQFQFTDVVCNVLLDP